MKDRTAALAALGGVAGLWALGRLARARRAIDFRGRHVLISGGSRGLGLALARRFAAEGARLTLLARTADDLDRARAELARWDTDVLTIPCDVRDRAAVEAAVARAVGHHGRLDVLVHDAGLIQVGPEDHMTEADYAETMGVHFWGAYYLTEAARPHLPRDGSARVVYVSSIGGRVAVAHLAPYSASKHALTGYADAMRAELAEEKIRVTTVTPGLMRTGSTVNAYFKGQHREEYAWFTIGNANPLLSMSSERAAQRIVEACRHGDASLTLTLSAKLATAANGLAPGLVGAAMKLADRLLPDVAWGDGAARRTGWESFSRWAPSLLTRPADRAVPRFNELRGHAPPHHGDGHR
ncbi:MAG TPA: SDR family oxidoreductase [Rubricoccaceae bacterium]|nr:SDR family oxidoreductase [Rubricoccaceae bacterium]